MIAYGHRPRTGIFNGRIFAAGSHREESPPVILQCLEYNPLGRNFVKTNAAIRCTPAMEAGITNSPWTVANLVEMIEG